VTDLAIAIAPPPAEPQDVIEGGGTGVPELFVAATRRTADRIASALTRAQVPADLVTVERSLARAARRPMRTVAGVIICDIEEKRDE
jgi:hypothetical protein